MGSACGRETRLPAKASMPSSAARLWAVTCASGQRGSVPRPARPIHYRGGPAAVACSALKRQEVLACPRPPATAVAARRRRHSGQADALSAVLHGARAGAIRAAHLRSGATRGAPSNWCFRFATRSGGIASWACVQAWLDYLLRSLCLRCAHLNASLKVCQLYYRVSGHQLAARASNARTRRSAHCMRSRALAATAAAWAWRGTQ